MSDEEVDLTIVSKDSDNLYRSDFKASSQQYQNDNGKYDWSSLSIGISKRIEEWCTDDLMGFKFDSVEDAEKFYNTYSSAMGFSVRKDDIRYYKNGTVSMRRWVYSKEGVRSKKNLARERTRRRNQKL